MSKELQAFVYIGHFKVLNVQGLRRLETVRLSGFLPIGLLIMLVWSRNKPMLHRTEVRTCNPKPYRLHRGREKSPRSWEGRFRAISSTINSEN